jgi:site-specific DNA recombinase
MKQLFAYIRVSTAKQGLGVSLQEQRAAIERFASRTGAEIIQWFEERKTAAKAGRPEFLRMVKLLRQGKAQGVVIHKIDRSTRNYRDWAAIDDLIEGGIEVHFANDDLDLRSRGGRLAADIQVVVAVDYIRNLREEALKGIHGRLKQGILPHHAPIGYLDRGAGKPKEIDPVRGSLVRRLFEIYATGSCTLRELTDEAVRLGLRNQSDNPLRLTQIHALLHNLFYAGVIRSARFGLFAGAHKPLVSRSTFDRVQDVLRGKFVRRTKHHVFLLRRLLRCKTCHRSLVASMVKGHVYYRCATMDCPTTSLREDAIESEIRDVLSLVVFSEEEAEQLRAELLALQQKGADLSESRKKALAETLAATSARMTRLTDLLLDGKIESEAHDERRAGLLLERQKLEQELAALNGEKADQMARVRQIVELARRLILLYETADTTRKRRLLEIVISNCVASGKTLEFSLREPFAAIAKRSSEQDCRPHWDTPLTFSAEELKSWGSDWRPELWASLQDILEPEAVQTLDPAA